jgi:hypothetical protein
MSGTVRRLTHWEQLDHGLQYTPTRKFLTIVPVILFFLARDRFYKTPFPLKSFRQNFHTHIWDKFPLKNSIGTCMNLSEFDGLNF